MKHFVAVLALVAFVGCTQVPDIFNTNSNNNSNIINGSGGLTDPNALPGTCTVEEKEPIRVDLNVPASVAVDASVGIDSTPKSAKGKRSDGCNISQGIRWTSSAQCKVADESAFTTTVKGVTKGACTLTASVPGFSASGSTVIQVN